MNMETNLKIPASPPIRSTDSLGVRCRYCGRLLRQVNIAKRGYCLKCCRIHRQVPLGRVVRRKRMDNDITPEDFAWNVRQWALDDKWSDHQFRVGVQIALKRLKTPNTKVSSGD